MSRLEVVILDDAAAVAAAAARRCMTAAEEAIGAHGRFMLALAGGTTPAATYRLLASTTNSSQIDWGRTQVFFGDERCVPAEHAWSNYRMAHEALLAHVPLPPGNIHRMHGERGPDAAAADYAQVLQEAFSPGAAAPAFDLILLGLGDDGHTASLFPGMPALEERSAAVVGTGVPAYARPQVARVTLTYPVFEGARLVLFLVNGPSKARALRLALAPGQAPEHVPAARVAPQSGRVVWLVDAAAAAEWRESETDG